jgi:predicted peptidase
MKLSTRILTLVVVSLLAASSTAQSPVERVKSQSGKAWVTTEVKAPRVSFHTFDSDAAMGKVSYHIYTSAAYDREAQRRLPVVYWLHGSGGGPLQAELIQAPRAGRQRAAEVLKHE